MGAYDKLYNAHLSAIRDEEEPGDQATDCMQVTLEEMEKMLDWLNPQMLMSSPTPLHEWLTGQLMTKGLVEKYYESKD